MTPPCYLLAIPSGTDESSDDDDGVSTGVVVGIVVGVLVGVIVVTIIIIGIYFWLAALDVMCTCIIKLLKLYRFGTFACSIKLNLNI